MPLKDGLSVFVSSTSQDLDSYRAVASQVILARGWTPIMNEYWGAMPTPVLESCYEKLKKADVMLLIVAYRRGCVPTVEQGGDGVKSVTAWELDFARKHKIDVLPLLASDTWPGKLFEQDQAGRDWVNAFRADLNQPAVFFDYEPEVVGVKEAEQLPLFRSKVGQVLLEYRDWLIEQEKNRQNGQAGDTDAQKPDYFDRAYRGILDGTAIPFVGSGVYSGALSIPALAKSLGVNIGDSEECLATAAEYRERYLGTREDFLKELHRILEERMLQTTSPPPVFDMLLNAKAPPLIISATCDLILERYLEQKGKKYMLVCHVVRSFDNEYDGKILVFRGKDSHEFCVADKITLQDADYVIYKPLGSPLLHDLLDPNLGIDTVVMTESDHLLLLGRLEHELTQIPTAMVRLLQRRPLLFMGYGLDVWHYRLVMQVFQLVQARGSRPRPIAVRQPTSPMEALAWSRLDADLVPLRPDDFAARVQQSLAKEVEAVTHVG